MNRVYQDYVAWISRYTPQASVSVPLGLPIGKQNSNIILGDSSFDSVTILDGSTFKVKDAQGKEQIIELYGVKARGSDESYGNWQTYMLERAFSAAVDKQYDVIITPVEVAGGKTVATVKIKEKGSGSLLEISNQYVDLAAVLTERGVIATKNKEPADGPVIDTNFHGLREAENKAQKPENRYGIWSEEAFKVIVQEDREKTTSRLAESIQLATFVNKRFGSSKKLISDSSLRIGDVELDIPPTDINISQMRSSTSADMLGNEARPVPTYTNRIVLKVNCVFNGTDSINDDLKRILIQYRFCPINLIRSKDLFGKLSGDFSYLEKAYTGSYFIPVTMDSYTLWSIKDHPNCVGATFQFSLFNFAAYFAGDTSEKIEYRRIGLDASAPYLENRASAQLKQNESFKSVVNQQEALWYMDIAESKIDTTLFLEEALHPYNLWIERILSSEEEQWTGGESHVEILKVSRISNLIRGLETSEEEISLEGKFAENPLDVTRLYAFENSVATLLATSVSVHYENQFAWQPVIGYSQPAAQYIGPGPTVISISAHTSSNEIIKKLQRTYNETYEQGRQYDDRYLILTPMTALAKASLGSMQHCNIQSMPGLPGSYEVNLTFIRSSYATNSYDDNPAGGFDDYWGLQRYLRVLDDSQVADEVKRQLDFLLARSAFFPVGTDVLGEWPIARKSGVGLSMNKNIRAAMNRVLNEVSMYTFNNGEPKWNKTTPLLNAYGFNHYQEVITLDITIEGTKILNNITLTSVPSTNGEAEEDAIYSAVQQIIEAHRELPESEREQYRPNYILGFETQGNILWNFDSLITHHGHLGNLLRAIVINQYLACGEDIISEFLYNGGVDANTFKEKFGESGTWNNLNDFAQTLGHEPWVERWSKITGEAIIDELKKKNTYKDWVALWNPERYSAFDGNQVRFSFHGNKCEANFLFHMFNAANNEKAREAFFIPKPNEKRWPKFIVGFSEVGGTLINETFTGNDEIEKEWHFTVMYSYTGGSDLEGWIEEAGKEEIQSMIDTFKKEKAKDEKREKILPFVKPYAAHRYYPGIMWFLNQSPYDSATVGDWFVHRRYENFNKELGDIADMSEDAISPYANTTAWKSVYFQEHPQFGNNFIKLQTEYDANSPLEIQRAIVYPDAKKDMSQKDASGKPARLGADGKVDTRIGVMPPREEGDAPFSSFNHLVYAKGYYGNTKKIKEYAEQYQEYERNKKWEVPTGGRAGEIGKIYNSSIGNSGRIHGGTRLDNASNIPITMLAPKILESSIGYDPTLAMKIDRSMRASSLNYNFEILGGLKNPKNISEDPTMEMLAARKSPSILLGDNEKDIPEDKFLEIFVYGIHRFKMLESIGSTGVLPDYDYTSGEQKVILARQINKGEINKLALEIYNDFMKNLPIHIVKLCTSDDVSYYLFHANTIPTEKIASRIALSSPNILDDDTRSFMAKQFMSSAQNTSGAEHAFPTFKLYIIESDTSDIKYYSLDDYYDFRLVQDLMVVRDRDNPAHILKARVVVDPRYITVSGSGVTTNQTSRDSLYSSEGETGSPSTIMADTEKDKQFGAGDERGSIENLFIGGKVPLIEGMRVALKLGYHSDPRLMDTVFIGTITALSPTGEPSIYYLEGRGDGRELLVPPTESSENISGETFSEIITKILRSNTSVVHFGKVYGSFLEKFSRKHYAVLALAKASIKTAGILGGGYGVGAGFGLIMRKANKRIGLSLLKKSTTKTASYVTMASLASYSGIWTDLVTVGKGMNESLRNYFAQTDGYPTFIGTKFNELGNWARGCVFDTDKASKQVGRILFDTQQRNNDPVDDNLFAVDIWNNLWNSDFNMTVNNKKTIWEVMQAIKRCYPNFALDVRPYGNRSTIFLGPLEFNYWRTDDPIIAMAPQLHETSNKALMGSQAISSDGRNVLDGMIKKDKYGGMLVNESKGGVAPFIPFQKHHLVTSMGEIISNGIRSTPERGWNHVIVAYGKSAQEDKDPDTINIMANQGIESGNKLTKYAVCDWTNSEDLAKQYAIGLLKEGVEKLYGGTLVIRGNERIEPHDKVYIADKVNNMHGWIQVDTVIHKFDKMMGFTTHIVPNLVCSINSDAYTTMGHIIRRKITRAISEMSLGGVLASGLGIVVGGALLGFITAITGGAAALVIGFLTVITTLVSLHNAGVEIAGQFKAVDNLTSDANVKEVYGFMPDIFNTATATAANDAFGVGIGAGLVVRYMKKIWAARSKENLIKGKNELVNLSKAQWANLEGRIKHSLNIGAEYDLIKKLNKFTGSKHTMSDLENMSPKQLQAFLEESADKVEKQQGQAKLDEVRKTVADNKTATTPERQAANTVSRNKADIRNRKTLIRAVGTTTKKAITGLGKTGVAYGLVAAVDMLPHLFEAFIAEHMAQCNVITVHPLWHHNSFMMNGLQGYRNQNAFMHLKDMIVNAKTILGKSAEILDEYMPIIYNGEEYKSFAEIAKKAEFVPELPKSEEEKMVRIKETARRYSVQYTIPYELIMAVMKAESQFVVTASSKEAFGLMQLTPDTFRDMAVGQNILDIDENIHAGVKRLRSVFTIFKVDEDSSKLDIALAGYNAGPGHVIDYLRGTNKHGGNPNLVKNNGIPNFPETQAYVPKVLKFYRENLLLKED